MTITLRSGWQVRGNQAESDGQPLSDLDGAKVQKLYAFLLLHRDRPHSRVSLASLLWGEMPEAHARQYLRKALWQLAGRSPVRDRLRPL